MATLGFIYHISDTRLELRFACKGSTHYGVDRRVEAFYPELRLSLRRGKQGKQGKRRKQGKPYSNPAGVEYE